MERHLSTGVATIVALMAAHRRATEYDHSASLVETIAMIQTSLTAPSYRIVESTLARHLHEAE